MLRGAESLSRDDRPSALRRYQPVKVAFERAAAEIRGQTITVRELLRLIGEQGLLLFCAFLAVPFLLPVAIPGTSAVLGLLMIVVGVALATDSLR